MACDINTERNEIIADVAKAVVGNATSIKVNGRFIRVPLNGGTTKYTSDGRAIKTYATANDIANPLINRGNKAGTAKFPLFGKTKWVSRDGQDATHVILKISIPKTIDEGLKVKFKEQTLAEANNGITQQDINDRVNELNEGNNTLYQLNNGESLNHRVASEKTIRDLAARLSDRIGIPVRFESDRTKKYKGKIENDIAYVNLAYATLDTPIHEILGHPIIRAIKNNYKFSNFEVESDITFDESAPSPYHILTSSIDPDGGYQGDYLFFNTKEEAEEWLNSHNKEKNNLSELYQNLLKELEYGKGKEVLDRIKRDYTWKESAKELHGKGQLKINTRSSDNKWLLTDSRDNTFKIFETKEDAERAKVIYEETHTYTLEEQQEEAIVELMSLMVADKLNPITDKNLISLLKQLLKQINDFIKSLIKAKELNINDIEADNTKFLIDNKLKELIKNGTIKKEC